MSKPKPVEARNLALHFLEIKKRKVTPQEMQKSVSQVKALFKRGYTYKQIKGAIDKYSNTMYSLGYLFSAMDEYLGELLLEEQHKKDLSTIPRGDNNIKNKEKYERANSKSRIGTEHYSYLFEKPKDD